MVRCFSNLTTVLPLLLLLLGCGDKNVNPPNVPAVPEPPEFAVGQVWNYDTREGEEASQLTVVGMDSSPTLGAIYHIAIDGLEIEPGKTEELDHLPVSTESLKASVTSLDRTLSSPPPPSEKYLEWQKTFESGAGNQFSKPLKEIVQDMAEVRTLKAEDAKVDPANLEFAALVEKANIHLQTLTDAHNATWNLGEAENWAADQEKGIISWTFEDGRVASAPMQIVGTYNTTKQSFLWGWDHPSVMEGLRKDAATVLAYAKKNKVEHLTKRLVQCTEEEAWEYAALANLLNERQGVYRGPAGPTYVFMTFGEITLKKNP